MKNSNAKGYAVLCLLFVLVSIIAFVVPTLKTSTFWTAYVFAVIAFAAQICIWKVAFGKGDTLKSKFLGFPVIHIGVVYLVIQNIAFAVFMFVPTLPVWSAVVICSCIVGVSAVCMIGAEASRGEIERVETKVQKKVFYLNELQADVEIIAADEADKEIKASLLRLAEKIRFSDPMSNDQLADLESRIAYKVESLRNAANKVELVTELTSLLNERNKKCKILK